MQQSLIAKKLQAGSIFCFWLLGTASRGCHGWNDSGLAHAPSGKPARKHDGEASDHTKRTTHWSNTRPALRIVPDAALREAQPYSSNKPEARFWSLLLFLFKQKKAARRRPLSKSIYWVYPCSFLYRRLLVSSQLSMVPVS